MSFRGKCEHSGHTQERDHNAGINLEKKAVRYTVSAYGVFTPTESVSLGNIAKQEAITFYLGLGKFCITGRNLSLHFDN